jgi:hypothetical protein
MTTRAEPRRDVGGLLPWAARASPFGVRLPRCRCCAGTTGALIRPAGVCCTRILCGTLERCVPGRRNGAVAGAARGTAGEHVPAPADHASAVWSSSVSMSRSQVCGGGSWWPTSWSSMSRAPGMASASAPPWARGNSGSAVPWQHEGGKALAPAQSRIAGAVRGEEEVVGRACGDVVGAVEHPTGDGAQARFVDVARAGVRALALDDVVETASRSNWQATTPTVTRTPDHPVG